MAAKKRVIILSDGSFEARLCEASIHDHPGVDVLCTFENVDVFDPMHKRIRHELTLGVDLMFSLFYPHIIPKKALDQLRIGAVNIHPSFLPWNRGYHTPFWGIMGYTPMGATIHWVDEGIDTGDIIGQAQFDVGTVMNAQDARARQRKMCVTLFKKFFPKVVDGTAQRRKQPHAIGSHHYKKDIIEATTFDGDHVVRMDQLIHLARATDCDGHGIYVRAGNGRFKVTMHVTREE